MKKLIASFSRERREKRPNGDIYFYERITAYDKKTRKTYTVSQKLKGKIKSGTQEIVLTRPKKHKGEGGIVDATLSGAPVDKNSRG